MPIPSRDTRLTHSRLEVVSQSLALERTIDAHDLPASPDWSFTFGSEGTTPAVNVAADDALARLASATEDLRRGKNPGASFPPSCVTLIREAANAGASEGAIAIASGQSLASVRNILS
jgi:hypothetical protein